MKPRSVLFIGTFILGLSLTMEAQDIKQETNQKNPISKNEKSVNSDQKVTVLEKVTDNTSFNEGSIPTPEEQGFIKKTVNGKDIYIKEEGQLLIQYTPKK